MRSFGEYMTGLPLKRRLEIIHTLLDTAKERGATCINDSIKFLNEHEAATLVYCVYGRSNAEQWDKLPMIHWEDELAEHICAVLLLGDTTSNPERPEQYVESSPVDEAAG